MKSLWQIEKKLSQKRKKKKQGYKSSIKTNYPWIKNATSRKAKAYMAFITDNSRQTPKGKQSRKKKQFFNEVIKPRVVEKFPNLYSKVRKYYKQRGNSLSKKHFYKLLYARLLNMYGTTFAEKTKEHPTLSNNTDLRTDYLSYE